MAKQKNLSCVALSSISFGQTYAGQKDLPVGLVEPGQKIKLPEDLARRLALQDHVRLIARSAQKEMTDDAAQKEKDDAPKFSEKNHVETEE